MQARNPAGASRHAELVASVNRASREGGGLGAIFAKTVADAMGVNQTDFECIDIISLRGRVTAGDLAAATGLTTGAVTGVIDRLEQAGLARRERDPDDRRKVYVAILPKTLAAGAAYYGPFEKAMNALIGSYSDAELALFLDFFTRGRGVILKEIERLQAAPPANPQPVRSPRRAAVAAPPRSRPRPRP